MGINLFNVYKFENKCFQHSNCEMKFSEKPLNHKPLGWVQNGSVGIINLTILTNNQMQAISQESGNYFSFSEVDF